MRPKLTIPAVFCLLSALSLLVNFAVQWRGEHAVNYSSEAARVSWALQHGRGFADPYLVGPSGPTAQMAPLYPALHALTGVVFGSGAAGWAAIVALTALAWSLQWTFAYDFMRFYGHPKAGFAAGLIGVLVPLPGRLFKWEAVFVGCALAAGACLMARLLEKPGPGLSALWGVVAATALLLSPAVATVFCAWGVILLWRGGLAAGLKVLVLAFLCAILPIGLWTARNYAVFGQIFAIRDNTGIELGVSNLDCAQAVLADNIASGCFAAVHPSATLSNLAELRRLGEPAFAARQMRLAMQWIRSHPRRFAALTVQRFAYFWFPLERADKRVLLNGIAISAATVFSFLALFWRRSAGFAVLAGALLCYPAAYYLAQGEQRYRYPVLWMSVLLASVGVELALHRRKRLGKSTAAPAAVLR